MTDHVQPLPEPPMAPYDAAAFESALRRNGLEKVDDRYSLTESKMRSLVASVSHDASRAPLATLYEARALLAQFAGAIRFTSKAQALQWLHDASSEERSVAAPASPPGAAPHQEQPACPRSPVHPVDSFGQNVALHPYSLDDFIRESTVSGRTSSKLLDALSRLRDLVCVFLPPRPADASASAACTADQTVLPAEAEDAQRPSIYIAYRPHHAAAWRILRNIYPIKATWIEDTGPRDAGAQALHWTQLACEIAACTAMVMYTGEDELPLHSALVEVGMALAQGVPVFVAAPGVHPDQGTSSPLEAWLHHPLVRLYTQPDAMTRALTAAAEISPSSVRSDNPLAKICRLHRDCAEAYQVIGAALLGGSATCTPEDVTRALDNLSAAADDLPRPHDDLLPWPLPPSPDLPCLATV